MRIAVDARELEGKPTGVGRYLANLLRLWLSGLSSDSFVLYHRAEIRRAPWMDSGQVELRRLRRGLVPLGSYWQQVVLPGALRREQPDVFFAPADSLPLFLGGPSLMTVHDLSYEAHPEWFGAAEGMRRRFIARRSAGKATSLVAISRFTRDELVSRYRVPPGKVRVVYHGIDGSLREAPFTPEEELRARTGLTGPVALVVGSIFERRLPMRTIRAFRGLSDLDAGLIIAGDDRRRRPADLRAQIRRLGLEGRVFWLEYCSEEDLCGLYRMASMLISLSLYEGFSLPPLEALSFGVPVIISARGALREVYGDAALGIEEESEETIAAAVRKLLLDGNLRDLLVDRGEALVRRLTLRACASRTLELIHKAAEAARG